MTREEAIKILYSNPMIAPNQSERQKKFEEAIDMAIEALSQPIVAKHFDIQSGYIYCSPQDAENVEVVVRCKDCYHAEDDITHMFCVYFHHKVYEDDYCSNAVERREESEAEECG